MRRAVLHELKQIFGSAHLRQDLLRGLQIGQFLPAGDVVRLTGCSTLKKHLKGPA